MTDKSDKERREHERVTGILRVKFQTAQELHEEFTHNISKGGMFIKTSEEFSIMQVLDIYLEFPNSFKAVKLTGTVVHILSASASEKTGAQPGVGVQFTNLSKRQIDEIGKVIEALLAGKAGPEGKDRRTTKRVSARLKVRFASHKALKERYTLDISKGGIFVPTPKPLNIGEMVNIVLVHPITGEQVELGGKVVRIAQKTGNSPGGMGISFSDLGPNTQEIERFVYSAGAASEAAEEGEVQGKIEKTGIENIIHMISQVVDEGKLVLKHKDSEEQGTLLFSGGKLVGVKIKPSGISGEKALYRIATWKTGTFMYKKMNVDGEGNWNAADLLKEGIRQARELEKKQYDYFKQDATITLSLKNVKNVRNSLSDTQKRVADSITRSMKVRAIQDACSDISDLEVLEALDALNKVGCIVLE